MISSSIKKNKINHRQRGQVLIEVLVASGVLTIGFLGILTLLNRSLGLNRVIADNYTGTYLATEGIEVVAGILEANALQGIGWGAIQNGCYEVEYDSPTLINRQGLCDTARVSTFDDRQLLTLDTNTQLYAYHTPERCRENSGFCRIIRIENISADEMRVNSVVLWYTRAGGVYSTDIEDHFYNRR